MKKLIISALMAICMSVGFYTPSIAGEEPSAAAKVTDLLVIRPMLVGATVVGAVGYVITLPITATVGDMDATRKGMVEDPYNGAFNRCLGCK